MALRYTLLLLSDFLLFTASIAATYDDLETQAIALTPSPPAVPVKLTYPPPAPIAVPVKPTYPPPALPAVPVKPTYPPPAPPAVPVKPTYPPPALPAVPVKPKYPPPPPYKAPTPPSLPPKPIVRSKQDCIPLCGKRCLLHSRKNICLRVCVTCCDRCRCVPPGTYGNREVCGKCYTDMVTRGGKLKCP